VPESELGTGDALDRLVEPSDRDPAIGFQAVPERKSLKNRLHLDLKVSGGRSVAIAELVAADARVVTRSDSKDPQHYSQLMGGHCSRISGRIG
jgi:hypothetical protein